MRKSGILMPVFSLPSPYGIGTLGNEAYRFVDFLNSAGQSVWQMLPAGQTGFGDSPYQSFSSFAGNPYFIDLDMLCNAGYLEMSEYWNSGIGIDPEVIDYGRLYAERFKILRTAAARFSENPPSYYAGFRTENAWWLDDYALFMAIKDKNGGRPWQEWERQDSRISLTADTEFYSIIQYMFYEQWNALRAYASGKGVEIMGDMPIYVAMDSADVWAHRDDFELDENGLPTEVAGCPPDAFSADGQLWGNPLYDWDKMKNESPGYQFWKSRIAHACRMFDIIRIDHFRGFEAYYAIPAGQPTARYGRWRKGPGRGLFDELARTMGRLPIVAEDLGYLTDDVRALLAHTGYPGMKVLQFAFDSRENSDYLPHNYDRNCVVYTGTHDNDTLMGWLDSALPEDVGFAKRYIRDNGDFCDAMIKTAMSSVGDTVIVPIQDYIGSKGRINIPSTPSGNWKWRIKPDVTDKPLAMHIREITELYRRI